MLRCECNLALLTLAVQCSLVSVWLHLTTVVFILAPRGVTAIKSWGKRLCCCWVSLFIVFISKYIDGMARPLRITSTNAYTLFTCFHELLEHIVGILDLFMLATLVQGTLLAGICFKTPCALLSVCWLFQGSLLLLVGALLGMPLMSTSMVAAHTYVSSR